MSKWISSKERMPNFHRYVLVKFKPLEEGHQGIAVAFRDGGDLGWKWTWCNPYSCYTFDKSESVTHWMPLP